MERSRQVMLIMLAVIAVGVFVLTDSVVASAVTMCLSRGLASFQTAIWLLRMDPQRSRAHVCGIFMVATGIWSGVLAAFVSLMVLVAIGKFTGQQPELDIAKPILVRLLGGIVFSSVLGFLATIWAALCGQPVWVNPRLRKILDDQFCVTPIYHPAQDFNYATFIVCSSVTCITLVPMYFALVHGRVGFSTLAFPACAFGAYLFLAPRTVALTARDCWLPDDSKVSAHGSEFR